MTIKLNDNKHKAQIKELVKEAQLLLLSSSETIQYIQERLGNGETISEGQYYTVARQLEDERGEKLIYLGKSKTAFAAAHMERIEQVKNVGKECWRLFYLNEGKPILQQSLLGKLLEVTMILTELENIIPNIMDIPSTQQEQLEGEGESNSGQPSLTYFQEELARAARVPTQLEADTIEVENEE